MFEICYFFSAAEHNMSIPFSSKNIEKNSTDVQSFLGQDLPQYLAELKEACKSNSIFVNKKHSYLKLCKNKQFNLCFLDF